MFFIAYKYFTKKQRLLKLCTESVEGELKGFQSDVKYTSYGSSEIRINSEPSPFAYYTVNEKTYKTHYTVQILKIGFNNKISTKYDTSSKKVTVKYNKDNPKIAYIEGDDLSSNKFFGYIYSIVGIVFMIVALIIY